MEQASPEAQPGTPEAAPKPHVQEPRAGAPSGAGDAPGPLARALPRWRTRRPSPDVRTATGTGFCVGVFLGRKADRLNALAHATAQRARGRIGVAVIHYSIFSACPCASPTCPSAALVLAGRASPHADDT